MGSRAVVTGASSGIGLAFAKHCAAGGHDLLLVARDEARLAVAASQISSEFGVECRTLSADLSTAAGVDAVIAAVADVDVDVLVANAGITRAAKVGEASPDDIDALMMLLTGGVIRLVEAVAPAMRTRGRGRIVVVSSIAALIPMPKSAVYAAAKASVTSYAKSIHHELRGAGVEVVVVNPGYVRTGLHRASGLEHLERRIPRWLWIDPIHVVRSADRGLARKRASVVPGRIYRLARPFLGQRAAQRLWSKIARRR
jgi:uncharacterized protein